MSYFSIKFKIIIAVIIFLLCPFLVFAQSGGQVCSSSGYTVATINGVLNSEDEAIFNRDSLELLLPIAYHGEKLTIEYLLNSTHMGGISDIFGAISQKAFENETVVDYDLIEMLKDASQKVKTQKLLLVAHSQGNFYANSFYDVVTTQDGGIPAQSIGVYSVATPSGRVVDSGTRWLTSETDKVIAWVVGNVPFRKIMPPNVRIELQDGDNIAGHGFSEAYLKYSSKRVVDDVQYSLNRLSKNTVQNESDLCISAPKSTVSHKVQGAMLAVADPVGSGAVWILGTGVNVTAFAYNTTESFAKWGSHMEAVAIMWTYHTTVAVAVWSYDTATTVAKTAWGMASTIGSFTYNVFTGALSNSQPANNSASVILATIPVQDLPIINVTDNNAITIGATASVENQFGATDTKQQPQTVFVFEPKVQSGTNAPKLVFVGSFPGGSAGAQVMGTQSTTPVIEEVVVVEEEIADNAGVAKTTPALSAPQCSQTLATDGCLLATPTVHFEWTNVAGADHYLLGKNGEYATTTDTIFDTEIKDFSDYTFEVVAVTPDGQSSATSTQAVSVATIPIAINEIAWMGTKANTSDEWFEIKNNTGHTIDLSQWELNAKDGTPHVKLAGTIVPHAYLIFERTDNTAVKDVDGEVYGNGGPQWALGNSGEQLNLSHASTTFDQTPVGAWVAGENSSTTKKTMERYSSREPGADPENWGTNLGYIKNGKDASGKDIEGTPGKQNSVSTLINKGQDITSDFTLTNAEEQYVIANTLRVSASSTLTVEPGVEIKFYDGWINVQGYLAVAGTKENPVIIDTFSGNQDGGISVGGGYTDAVYQGVNASATLNYVNIENINHINAYDNTHLDISNADLLNSTGGIYAQDTAQVSIASSSIRGTQDNHAVAGYENSKITIASSTITDTFGNDAVGAYNGTMIITNTVIDGVQDYGGIFASRGTLSIASSTIKNVSESGMSLLRATSTISDVVIENAGWTGIEIYRGNTTIASTTISDITGWTGVYVGEGIMSISSSTIKNVADYGIYAYKATSTISNVTVENGGSNGVDIYQGTATITDTSVSGFTEGAGISVFEPASPVTISGGEITGNAIGVEMDSVDSVIITDMSSVHDNGTSEADNVFIWPPTVGTTEGNPM